MFDIGSFMLGTAAGSMGGLVAMRIGYWLGDLPIRLARRASPKEIAAIGEAWKGMVNVATVRPAQCCELCPCTGAPDQEACSPCCACGRER
jgi:hypothetical protein